eukprot:Skav224184  [mRNA]  locus=scaffold1975:268569:277499:+ [translate_table: standard]
MACPASNRFMGDVMDAEAEKTFAFADQNCDGALSLSELDRLRSEASLPKYTTDLLGSADVDADNKLSKLEFVAAMRKSGVASSDGPALEVSRISSVGQYIAGWWLGTDQRAGGSSLVDNAISREI